ncbi:MAG: TetR/AcrR family transcriptional regulator [candidate division WOR-3 bacterium]|nr:TetR/AcrR family transcriptional regulator [candidate division WOR-3 bacterium]
MTDQSVRRKEQIMKEARKLFAKKGYHEVKVSDVAKKCRVAKGTVYLYFDSKSDLFVQVFIQSIDHIIQDIRKILFLDNDLKTTLMNIFDYYEDSVRKDGYFRRFVGIHRGFSGNFPTKVANKIKKSIFLRIEDLENEVVDFLGNYFSGIEINLHDLYFLLVAILVAIAKSDSETIKDTALSLILGELNKHMLNK